MAERIGEDRVSGAWVRNAFLAAAIAALCGPVWAQAPAQAARRGACDVEVETLPAKPPRWSGRATVTCREDQNGWFVLGERALVGVSLAPIASDDLSFEDDWRIAANQEIDLPVKVVLVDPAKPVQIMFETNRAPPQVAEVKAEMWPMQALRPCASGRDGCRTYGYQLGCDERLDGGESAAGVARFRPCPTFGAAEGEGAP